MPEPIKHEEAADAFLQDPLAKPAHTPWLIWLTRISSKATISIRWRFRKTIWVGRTRAA